MTKNPKKNSIKEWPEGERPREKLIQLGTELLTDAELLAILLRIGNEGASAIDMGRQLIAQLGGLQGIDRAHAEEIMQIKGLGLAKTAQLKIICDLTGHRPNVYVEAGYALKHHEQNRLIFLFEPKNADDKVPFDLSTFKYIQVSQAAEISGRLTSEIKAILEDAGAVLEGGAV